ncbi:MAG: class I SAM-dependent methyltransferase [Candidatus Bathyarchaeota archaeon]|nr:class I SAM-dependent methyltransferase [Candidatus Bathyarchaeota archaeon]
MSRENDIAKVWDEASEAWTSFVREGRDYYRDDLNNPATFKLIGDIKGKRVLDLACGEGYNTRILAKKGAKVTGVDLSKKMIELAREKEVAQNLGITYIASDAAHMKTLPDNHFDLATCFMSLQDIEQLEDAISEIARLLKTNGRFIFSIPHPCFEELVKDQKGWRWRNKSAAHTEKETELEKGTYSSDVRFVIHWTMERLTQPFKTVSFHRTISDYSQALFQNGFHISRLVEPKPTMDAVLKHPALEKVLETPQSMIFEAVKPPKGEKR